MKRWPPLYSLMIASLVPLHDRTADAAMTVNAILLGVLVLLTGTVVGGNWRIAMAASVVVGCSLWWRYHYVLSEAAFYPLLLGGFFCLDRYMCQRSRGRLLVCAAVFGLVLLTRYSGIAFVVSAGVFVLRAMGGRHWRDAALFWLIAITPCAAWMVRNIMVAGAASGRGIDPDLAYMVTPVLIDLIVGVTLLLWAGRIADHLSRAMVAAAGAYMVFIAFSIVCIDHATPMNFRILSPAGLLLFVALARTISRYLAAVTHAAAV